MGVDGFRAEGVLGLGSEDVVSGVDVHVIQHAGGSHVGNNEDAVGGGALSAVAGNGTHSEIFFANTLGDEGGGAAAVTVGSPLAAQSQHGFAQLIVIEAHGVVGAAAVIHTNDQSAVFLDAHHGTGGGGRGALFGLGDQLAVLNGHAEGDADCMEQDAFFQILVEVGSVEGLHIAGDVAFGILENIKDGRGRSILALDTDVLAVVDQNAGSVGIIVQVSVHTADDVVAEVFLVILCHVGQFLVGPVCFVVGVLGQLVDLMVSGNDGYIRVGRVNFDNVKHLSAGTGCIVEHDLGLNGCAGYEDVILLGDYVVVAVGAEGGTVKNDIVLCPVGDRRQSGQRQNANDHHNCEDHGDHAGFQRAVHEFVFLLDYFIFNPDLRGFGQIYGFRLWVSDPRRGSGRHRKKPAWYTRS